MTERTIAEVVGEVLRVHAMTLWLYCDCGIRENTRGGRQNPFVSVGEWEAHVAAEVSEALGVEQAWNNINWLYRIRCLEAESSEEGT